MRTCNAESQIPILKKTTGLCPSRSYYSLICAIQNLYSKLMEKKILARKKCLFPGGGRGNHVATSCRDDRNPVPLPGVGIPNFKNISLNVIFLTVIYYMSEHW